MVDVQHRTLRALEQEMATRLLQPIQISGHIPQHGLEFFANRHQAGQHLRVVKRLFLEILGEDEIMIVEQFSQSLLKQFRMKEITRPDASPGNLVLLGRTYTTPRGADGLCTTSLLAGKIELHVNRQNQRAGFADHQPITHGHTRLLQHANFMQQGFG